MMRLRRPALTKPLQVMQVIGEGLRTEGSGFLMKGWTPAWLRLTYVFQTRSVDDAGQFDLTDWGNQTTHSLDVRIHGEAAGARQSDHGVAGTRNGLTPGPGRIQVPKSGRLDQLSQSSAAASSHGYMLNAGSNSLLTLLSASTIWSSDMDENWIGSVQSGGSM